MLRLTPEQSWAQIAAVLEQPSVNALSHPRPQQCTEIFTCVNDLYIAFTECMNNVKHPEQFVTVYIIIVTICWFLLSVMSAQLKAMLRCTGKSDRQKLTEIVYIIWYNVLHSLKIYFHGGVVYGRLMQIGQLSFKSNCLSFLYGKNISEFDVCTGSRQSKTDNLLLMLSQPCRLCQCDTLYVSRGPYSVWKLICFWCSVNRVGYASVIHIMFQEDYIQYQTQFQKRSSYSERSKCAFL